MAAVALDTDGVLTGPAKLTLNDEARGHTQGGANVTIATEMRDINVDEFGSAPARVIHMGDDFRIETSLAQFVSQIIQDAYTQGTTGSTPARVGVGRKAGYVMTDQDVKLIPFDTNDAAAIQIFNGIQAGEVSISYSHENDRVVPCSWRAIPDDAKTDGENMGKIYFETPYDAAA